MSWTILKHNLMARVIIMAIITEKIRLPDDSSANYKINEKEMKNKAFDSDLISIFL